MVFKKCVGRQKTRPVFFVRWCVFFFLPDFLREVAKRRGVLFRVKFEALPLHLINCFSLFLKELVWFVLRFLFVNFFWH